VCAVVAIVGMVVREVKFGKSECRRQQTSWSWLRHKAGANTVPQPSELTRRSYGLGNSNMLDSLEDFVQNHSK
jgi:hypothetical protein